MSTDNLEVIASRPLIMAEASRCVQKLIPGEVKRVQATRDPLIGYHLACPKCGFRASYSEREVGYAEEPLLPGKAFPKLLTGMTRPPLCYFCGHIIAVRGRELVALRPEGGARLP